MSSKSDMYDKYGDIIPDGYTVSDKMKEMLNKRPIDWSIPDDLDYNSPIELIVGNLQTQIENDAVKVVQSYGFNVDKVELEKALKYDREQYDKGYADARKRYERPKGEWIPVSERLPEDMQKVLVWFEYYRYGDYNCMYQTYGFGYVCDGKWSPFINGETGWQDARIIAWMPLPEPYKETEK